MAGRESETARVDNFIVAECIHQEERKISVVYFHASYMKHSAPS